LQKRNLFTNDATKGGISLRTGLHSHRVSILLRPNRWWALGQYLCFLDLFRVSFHRLLPNRPITANVFRSSASGFKSCRIHTYCLPFSLQHPSLITCDCSQRVPKQCFGVQILPGTTSSLGSYNSIPISPLRLPF
jgi:hypothetical protein